MIYNIKTIIICVVVVAIIIRSITIDTLNDMVYINSPVTTNMVLEQYPEATYIWAYLIQHGFNQYVSAGILGNIMTEVGGQSLNLNPTWDTPNYYGMCMWSKFYCPDVSGLSLSEQCEYLTNTMQYEFDTFGNRYCNGFNYQNFLSLGNEQDAALAFAKCYERCASDSYYIRQQNATKALLYFTEHTKGE